MYFYSWNSVIYKWGILLWTNKSDLMYYLLILFNIYCRCEYSWWFWFWLRTWWTCNFNLNIAQTWQLFRIRESRRLWKSSWWIEFFGLRKFLWVGEFGVWQKFFRETECIRTRKVIRWIEVFGLREIFWLTECTRFHEFAWVWEITRFCKFIRVSEETWWIEEVRSGESIRVREIIWLTECTHQLK